MIIAGASAYARTIDFKKFREIADEVSAYLMVDGVGLHNCIVASKQFFCALNGKILHQVDAFTAAIVPLSWIPFCIFVRSRKKLFLQSACWEEAWAPGLESTFSGIRRSTGISWWECL